MCFTMSGCLIRNSQEVATLFDPSVSATIAAIGKQLQTIQTPTTVRYLPIPMALT
jgi:hypothetical protein